MNGNDLDFYVELSHHITHNWPWRYEGCFNKCGIYV